MSASNFVRLCSALRSLSCCGRWPCLIYVTRSPRCSELHGWFWHVTALVSPLSKACFYVATAPFLSSLSTNYVVILHLYWLNGVFFVNCELILATTLPLNTAGNTPLTLEYSDSKQYASPYSDLHLNCNMWCLRLPSPTNQTLELLDFYCPIKIIISTHDVQHLPQIASRVSSTPPISLRSLLRSFWGAF